MTLDALTKNPAQTSLIAAAAALVLGGAYLVSTQASRLAEEEAMLAEKTARLRGLEGNKPFPDQANIDAANQEGKELEGMIGELGKTFGVEAPPVSPQAFQDELNKSVGEIEKIAAEKNVSLPDGFYLGFEQYKTELPGAEIAPDLGLQLRSVHAVAKALVESGATALGPFFRSAVPGEQRSVQSEDSPARSETAGTSDLTLAPFDISFESNQSAFRLAFNRILELEPPIFVRLVAVSNSAPQPPAKAAAAAETPAAGKDADTAEVKAVVGRETLAVNLRLASALPTRGKNP